jgi:hypothetical protein
VLEEISKRLSWPGDHPGGYTTAGNFRAKDGRDVFITYWDRPTLRGIRATVVVKNRGATIDSAGQVTEASDVGYRVREEDTGLELERHNPDLRVEEEDEQQTAVPVADYEAQALISLLTSVEGQPDWLA